MILPNTPTYLRFIQLGFKEAITVTPSGDTRVTEAGDTRVTEDGNTRITE